MVILPLENDHFAVKMIVFPSILPVLNNHFPVEMINLPVEMIIFRSIFRPAEDSIYPVHFQVNDHLPEEHYSGGK
jgi:hypothetical protein